MTHDLLDKAQDYLEEKQAPEPVSLLAQRLLKTQGSAVASMVLERLLSSDERFQLSGGSVSIRTRKNRFSNLRVEEVPIAVIDFETCGCPPADRAMELGVSCYQGGKEVAKFRSLIWSGMPISPFVTRLTGLKEKDLEGKPSFPEIWPEVKAVLDGRVLVAHNLPFDRSVLKREVRLTGSPYRAPEAEFCTLRMAKRLIPKGDSRRLNALVQRFGIRTRRLHRAYEDASATGKLFYHLLELARERVEISTWADLIFFLNPGVRKST